MVPEFERGLEAEGPAEDCIEPLNQKNVGVYFLPGQLAGHLGMVIEEQDLEGPCG